MARFKTTPNPRTRPAKQLKSNTEECANSIALKRKDNEARPRPGPAPGQGWDYHCGDFEGHRLAAALGAGLLRRGREEEAWTDADV
jgi:hypothetical protein